MRLLVFGSRTWGKPVWKNGKRVYTDQFAAQRLADVLFGLVYSPDFDWEENVIIEGEAPGADELSRLFVEGHVGVEALPFPADWDKHGGRAGPMRNSKMLREGKPDIAIGFIDKPLEESRGSLDMATKLRKAKVPTFIVRRYA